MKKKFKLENLDCAHCAQKMEDAINALPDVEEASVSFMTQKLTIVADEDKMEAVIEQAVAEIAKVEPDCVVVR
ncbi:MAG: cation transporter [Firmicutes bacterium]|nr:cation transporter [Bacillota bacterium]